MPIEAKAKYQSFPSRLFKLMNNPPTVIPVVGSHIHPRSKLLPKRTARVDNVFGASNFVCRCVPIKYYDEAQIKLRKRT
jgi:hypothetical protein